MALRALAVAVLATLLLPALAPAQEATIRRTDHGIPHISAKDYTGLAYGYGYALAQDNLCVIADQYVTVRGERSRFFGPENSWEFRSNGSVNKNLESDFFFKRIIAQGTVEKLMAQAPPNGPRPEIKEAVKGYVNGYNRYLRDVGVANHPDPACKGADWVRPIEEIDAYRRFYQLALLASGAVAIDGIGGAQPPAPGDVGGVPAPVGGAIDQLAEELPLGGIGSNAYGIGREQTDNGKGMLLGNPHFPWDGSERFYQSHLTIPGKVDVQGGSLMGVPIVLIGNTRGLAWSHTVSTAFRFTPFELKLVPGSPTTYLVDGRPKEMTKTELSVQVKTETGLEERKRTLYDTEYGPVFTELLGQPLFPWTQGNAYAMGDANADNFRYLNHFFETNLAQSVREYDQVIRRNQGIPWVNSIAADSKGEAYYADISVVPHVTDDHAQRCNTALGTATFQALRLPVLDGARSSCDWGRDPSAIQPGTFGPQEHLPSMFRTDYVMNSNDSYWLGNVKQRLEGFPRIVGDERTERALRTRIGLKMVDGQRFTLRKLQDTVFNNRQYAGELWMPELLQLCDRDPSIAEPCAALRKWNLRDDLDSRGALLFRRFAQRLLGGGPTDPPAPFRVPYDNEDPVNTPRGLLTEDPRVRKALQDAANELKGLEVPLDAPLGDVQNEIRNGERLPIHGGPGGAGVFNAINVSKSDLKKGGYDSIEHGSSYVQAVQFRDGACPVVPRTILTYSQSTDPTSPWHSDQTRMYARKQWNAMPFCEPDVARATISTTRLSSADRGAPRVCATAARRFRATVRPRRRGLRFDAGSGRSTIEVRRVTSGRRVVDRRVARFKRRTGVVSWRARAARRPGIYTVRIRSGRADRRFAFRRAGGRFRKLGAFHRGPSCDVLRGFRLGGPVFGGKTRRALRVSFASRRRARVSLQVLRGRRVVRTIRRTARAGRIHRVRIRPKGLRRGTHRVRITVRPAGRRAVHATLRSRRL